MLIKVDVFSKIGFLTLRLLLISYNAFIGSSKAALTLSKKRNLPVYGENFPCFLLVQFIYYCSIVACFCSQMKGCIKVLKEQPPDSVEGLLNALRYVWFSLRKFLFVFFPVSLYLVLFTLEA